MKNLKRIFSLALAGTMLAGMLAIGASAAEFTDAEDIKNDDAVNFMVALNIINGKPDGSFDPEATVSRAEMAKMITIALNGGKEPVLGTQSTPKFTDIGGHWAQKYIEYCANLGIISGRGNGTFDPNGTVTGTEAAKMVLVAMGYDSTVFKFSGADWAINVNTEANNATPNKLYKGIESIDPNTGLSRDNAAQLIFNGVQDHIMAKSPSLTITNGEITYNYTKQDGTYGDEKTILTEKYGYKIAYGFVTDVDYIEDSKDYDVTLDDGAFNSTIATGRTTLDEKISFKGDVSYLYGQLAKVVYDEDDKTAMGIYAADSKILATVVVNDLPDMDADATTAKISGTTYRFDGTNKQAQNVPVYEFLKGIVTGVSLDELAADASSLKEYALDLIDNDGNGRINCVVMHPVTVGKVTYLGKDTISINNGIGSGLDLEEDINVYEGVKKDDYVIATAAANTVDGKIAIEKAETITGTVGAARASGEDTAKTNIRVNGTWYAVAEGALSHTTPAINDEVDLVLVNGFYAYSETSKTTSKDLLVITAVGGDQDFTDARRAKVAFVDGTTATVTVELADDDANAGLSLGTASGIVGKLFTYELDGNTYVLTKATTDNTGYKAAVSGSAFDADKDTLGTTTYVDDDAVVFVLYKDKDLAANVNGSYTAVTDITKLSKVATITGKALKAWSKDTSATYGTTGIIGFSDEINGLAYAKVLVVAFTAKELPGASGDTKYGYIVSRSYQEKDGGNIYTYFDLWNGTETVSVREKGAKVYTSGTVIAFKDLGDDQVEIVKSTSDFSTGALTGYSDTKLQIKVGGGTELAYAIDKDTTVLYINTTDKKGAESSGFELATKLENGKYEQNVYFIINNDTAKHVEAIFVEMNNKIKGSSAV